MGMTTYLAFLRGINVGGNKTVSMADLRAMLERLGFEEPRSLLASGNLVFRCAPRSAAALERALQAETRRRIGLEADFLVRTGAEWKAIVAGNPFRNEARDDPGHLLLMMWKTAPDAGRIRELEAAIPGREDFRAAGRHAYVVYPDGVGRSKFTHALIEKKLGTRGTARNWNTVLKLEALAGE
jgi:uncharacterized protein (DUF1697 family)